MIAALFYPALVLLKNIRKLLRTLLSGIFFSVFIMHATLAEAMSAAEAEELIRSTPCINGLNIDTVLEQKINTASQRDLGWQVFEEDGIYIVERAVLISKSMQLRYRWQIDGQGKLQPASDRAEDLCALNE